MHPVRLLFGKTEIAPLDRRRELRQQVELLAHGGAQLTPRRIGREGFDVGEPHRGQQRKDETALLGQSGALLRLR